MTSRTKKVDDISDAESDMQLALLEAQRSVIFENIQRIYDDSRLINTNEEAKERFLNAYTNVESLYNKFNDLLVKYNERLLLVFPHSKANFNAMTALEQLYGCIKRVGSQVSEPPTAAAAAACAPRKSRPSLPPIELTSFDGDIRSWPLFYASFKSTVHDNQSLSDSEKLYYLIGKITGKAKTACAGITPCAENYNLLFQTLINKYEDKRMLAATYLNQLLEFKPLSRPTAHNLDLFTDNFVSAVKALQNIKVTNLSDLIILHIALKKLDPDTVLSFENNIRSTEIPTFGELVEFIKSQSKILQRSSNDYNTIDNNKKMDRLRSKHNSNPPNYQSFVSTLVNHSLKCLCSNIVHSHLYKCPSFEKISPEERFKRVKENNSCVNCLCIKHKVSSCKSSMFCKICQSKHHTSLHFIKSADQGPNRTSNRSDARTSPVSAAKTTAAPPQARPSSGSVLLCSTAKLKDFNISCVGTGRVGTLPSTVLLATAQVIMYDSFGKEHLVRCLLDTASQCNFITTNLCNKLGIQSRNPLNTIVKGIGATEKNVKGSTSFCIYSRFNKIIKYEISALMIDYITDSLPSAVVDVTACKYSDKLPLADASFGTPGPVDVLLGAALFPHLLLPGVARADAPAALPPAIHTALGYVVMGSVPTLYNQPHSTATSCCAIVESDKSINNLLRNFWEIEELPVAKVQSPDDNECEMFFCCTTKRDPISGRYIVGLPFREDPYSLGDSYKIARNRFLCLERKLEAAPALRLAYDNVIREYLKRGYLSIAPQDEDNKSLPPRYFIPHHGVIREDKVSTKCRIVLDASSKTSSSISLNDILHSGQNLQGDLFKIILNFRLFRIGLSADCRQMFLNIEMRESDRRFQNILYRYTPGDPVTTYRFNRVCFGLKSSPFHALRVVRQLISDEGDGYPRAKEVATSSLFMDDVAFSVPDEEQAVATAEELISFFKRAQWDLVKWSSNSRQVLDSIPDSHKLLTEVDFDKSIDLKVLGLRWATDSDTFYFKINTFTQEKCTKRSILSFIARLWDLMGFVAPIILYAKLFIKKLWLLKIGWDDEVPSDVCTKWKQFCFELPLLNNFKIPRHLGVAADSKISLVGFADASEAAYGGVVYLHVESAAGRTVRLVCAKSKVAPMKQLSVARLELCAVLLLSQLLRLVYDNYSSRLKINVYAFTDSKVVLYWLKGSPHRWQTFVANRVVKITDNISPDVFYHVAGVENPADCLSRGLTPQGLIAHPLWMHGPLWLDDSPSQWPTNEIDFTNIKNQIPERKVLVHAVTSPTEGEHVLSSLTSRVSSWTKLLRIIIYIYRFSNKLPRSETLAITSSDLKFAENKLLLYLQNKYFKIDLLNLQAGKKCSPALLKLNSFLDDGLIRVGGRLGNSELNYSHKHPVVLPHSDPAINLLIDFYHKKYLHAGPELLLSLLRHQYWILGARNVVRRQVHKCNTCFRLTPKSSSPLMADLPDIRVVPAIKAFAYTGCDYAGPIQYVPIRKRGARSLKAYLCVFTCLTTRAVHIEVAGDLSTSSFLSALKRFLSRRGPVQVMYSDNGTNFVGASKYLRELYNFLNREYNDKFEIELAESRIVWKFIPPASPHFGGCWESMVKLIKNHLFRVIGQQLLSLEELNTVLTQVECLLNSRPLTVLSSDPSEPLSLTPSHFLHTAPINSMPAPAVDVSMTLRDRHTLVDSLVQSFWKRWRVEYLHNLQVRAKWNSLTTPIVPGSVVVIRQDNVPPLSWPLGVIDKVHPSKDGTVRVVTVKTSKGSFLRPVVRLCPLPTQ